MPSSHRWARCAVLACLLLAACVPGADSSTAATAPPLSTIALPTSPAEPLPEVAFSNLVVRPGKAHDEWVVLGMAYNKSASTLTSVAVRIELLDEAGEIVGEATTVLPLPVLQSGGASPFLVKFERAEPPAQARANLVSFQFSYATATALRPGTMDVTPAPDGVYVRGLLSNEGPTAARPLAIVLSWQDASRSLMGLTTAILPGAIAQPGESLPWIAHASGATTRSHFDVFVGASAVETPQSSSLIIADAPVLRMTSQGNAFVTGSVRNTGPRPIVPEFSVVMSASRLPVALQVLRTDVPLLPGETLTFLADEFVGMEATLGSVGLTASETTLVAYLDGHTPDPATPQWSTLPLSIVQVEAIGSSLFLKGGLSNPKASPVSRATVFFSLRATSGEPLSARWLEVPIPPGAEEIPFTVDLPLPAGVDPAMCEYDVRAFGLPQSESPQ